MKQVQCHVDNHTKISSRSCGQAWVNNRRIVDRWKTLHRCHNASVNEGFAFSFAPKTAFLPLPYMKSFSLAPPFSPQKKLHFRPPPPDNFSWLPPSPLPPTMFNFPNPPRGKHSKAATQASKAQKAVAKKQQQQSNKSSSKNSSKAAKNSSK